MDSVIAEGFFKAMLERYATPILDKIQGFSSEKWNEFLIKFDMAF